jgi:hypothetical protein
MQSLAAFIIGGRMELAVSHDGLVITADDLSHQEKVLLQAVCEGPEPVNEVAVQTVSDVQTQSVDPEILDPVPDCVEEMADDCLISKIELHQIVISFPALIPQAVLIGGIAAEINMEPVPVGGVLAVLQDILKLREAASDVIEDTVQDNSDPVPVQFFTQVAEILIGPQPDIDPLVIPRIIAVGIGLKQRAEIDGADPQLCQVRDPVLDPADPVLSRFPLFLLLCAALVPVGCPAQSQRIDLIKYAFLCPHKYLFSPPQGLYIHDLFID